MLTDPLLDALWQDYTAITPQAIRIHGLFAARGETIVNDHVALRTYGRRDVGLEALARPFVTLGWEARDDYAFPDKHLRARYYQHPTYGVPKVFISELLVDELSAGARATIDELVATLPAFFGEREDLPYAGRPWTLPHATYQALLEESEYAAWVAAFGFRVNHFTVDVGQLTGFADLPAVNAFLAEHGFELNGAGGVVKGSPAQHLEQSSTVADAVDVTFSDGVQRVPSCYYELARRYRLASGELFQGFVPTSADKLFESTDVKR